MKKIYNYTFQLVGICFLFFSLFFLLYFKINVEKYETTIQNVNLEKTLDSTLFVKNQKEKKQESIKEVEEENVDTSNSTSKIPQDAVSIIDTSSFTVLSKETVNISHYGHDCSGCKTGLTASGYYVGDGRIYYQDSTFGSVRIVAADSKYPLGTILRLEYPEGTITAIVLDRGGGIGDGKRFQIDLLTTSEKESYQLGVVKNASLEVLRLGY